jgi:phosphatidate cytidylyltransferase
MTTFQTRALSAAVFGIVMMVGLFWNELSFKILFSLIMAGCAWEFLNLTLEKGNLRRFLGFLFSICFYLLIFNFDVTKLNPFFSPSLFVMTVPLFFLFFIAPILSLTELFQKSEKPFYNISIVFTSLFYIAVPFSFLSLPVLTSNIGFSLEGSFKGYAGFTPHIVAGMLFLTWANDSFAYIIGSRIGKTPLFPRISPKKTWEGTIGGGLMCMVTAGIIGLFFKELSTLNWVVIGGIVAVFGTLGDLVESMLKRSVGVKDSGSIMPGHGGFLDRFDAFMFVIPFVYAYLLCVR